MISAMRARLSSPRAAGGAAEQRFAHRVLDHVERAAADLRRREQSAPAPDCAYRAAIARRRAPKARLQLGQDVGRGQRMFVLQEASKAAPPADWPIDFQTSGPMRRPSSRREYRRSDRPATASASSARAWPSSPSSGAPRRKGRGELFDDRVELGVVIVPSRAAASVTSRSSCA